MKKNANGEIATKQDWLQKAVVKKLVSTIMSYLLPLFDKKL